MSDLHTSDPYAQLGLPSHASEDEIRARYLELVKQFPPERDPDRFRAVRAAYEAIKDPLTIAKHLLAPPPDIYPSWQAILDAQQARPPRLSTAFVLSLGNRDSNELLPARDSASSQTKPSGTAATPASPALTEPTSHE